jgi:hypothetical protein
MSQLRYVLPRTIKYKSALARDSFAFEMLGAAIVGRSSPGILCLLENLATAELIRNGQSRAWESGNPSRLTIAKEFWKSDTLCVSAFTPCDFRLAPPLPCRFDVVGMKLRQLLIGGDYSNSSSLEIATHFEPFNFSVLPEKVLLQFSSFQI